MAINVLRIDLLGENPTQLPRPFSFQITLECLQALADDLEWRLTYVGSAESEKYDQVLDSILVGPIALGMSKFVLESPGPNPSLIPTKDLIGITCVLLTGLYQNREFIRVGYFVNNEYDSPELNLAPPPTPDYSRIIRSILVEKPRVTRYPIDWSGEANGVIGLDMSNGGSNMSREDQMQLEEPSFGGNNLSNGQALNSESWDIYKCDFVSILKSKLALKIFQYLEEFQLATCTKVSHLWRKTIHQGVNWKVVDLSQVDWAAHTLHEKEQLLNFVFFHSSPQLEELLLCHCDGIDDKMLFHWLSKCGSSLKYIDISWCIKLTQKSIYHIIQFAPVLEFLKVIWYKDTKELIGGTNTVSSIEDNVILIKEICSRYKGRLQSLQFSGLSDQCLSIISDNLGQSLKYLSIPFSVVSEAALSATLSRCPSLDELGLQFVNISANFLNELRNKYKVRGSHHPEDFSIEISAGDEDDSILCVSLKEWPTDIDVTNIIRRLLPEGATTHTEEIRFKGEPKKVAILLSQAGFDEINIKDDELDEDIQDEMISCTICGEASAEDDMVLCDECEAGYHPECVDLDPGAQTEKFWLCPECSKSEKGPEEDIELHMKKKQKV